MVEPPARPFAGAGGRPRLPPLFSQSCFLALWLADFWVIAALGMEGPWETIAIKAGSLDTSVDGVSRKLPGMIIPAGAKQFPKEFE